ncbi:MAG: hypothetical protein LKF87_13110 [Clostridium tyrobutyricum]|uniref:hypothetical protein n=1 Tax=Clostridium tyrobutyricum TaxID=1519 RepID=UPI00243138D6|nr:hypothetical protein [Clostridium tyrobutyricum]MCH4199427.1 hypothetical protein [Clostridium tyrobutyricum]MCH4238525.1 hypothetical protein [Clostridium tyrobutyricum]MCH4259858.1 hypothetical protein [Clostridium tyrobutyricum]MCI1240254.1 hypothetical protein [Clostridium tyrobutyricum]MCI1651647.1 hypothetical protein [Clostridium tyrobutyricum]
MSKMYIKAIVKEVIGNDSDLQVRLEGVAGFILKSKDYEEETELIKEESKDEPKENSTNSTNNFELEDTNIFIDNNKIFILKNVDEKFLIKNKIQSLIKDIFVSQKPYIFGLEKKDDKENNKDDKYEIISIRKCD